MCHDSSWLAVAKAGEGGAGRELLVCRGKTLTSATIYAGNELGLAEHIWELAIPDWRNTECGEGVQDAANRLAEAGEAPRRCARETY